MPLFDEQSLAKRQQQAANALSDVPATILVMAGEPIGIPGGHDQTYPFIVHPEYYWLTGSRRWGGAMLLEPGSMWQHFQRPVDVDEQLWEGAPQQPQENSLDVALLHEQLEKSPPQELVVLGDKKSFTTKCEWQNEVQLRFDAVRRPKDAAELLLIRKAIAATAAGFARAEAIIQPGVTERGIQIELEAEMFRHGAEGTGYDSIVGAGTRAAILHSIPGATRVGPEDLVLIDAGGHSEGYTADVTRTFPGGDTFSAEQQAIYDVVLDALHAGTEQCTSGIEWHDVHRTAAARLAEGLRHLGILKIPTEEALDTEAIALFFPHGIGHMVGLGVRDVGGHAPDREPGRKCCGARVRVDLPLEPGFLMTVEPGLYFVPAILEDPERRETFNDAVAWEVLDRWQKVGGVRLEDNVLVTEGQPEVLTAGIGK